MIKALTDAAWEDFEYWLKQDKKTFKRILQLLKDIDRNGYEGLGARAIERRPVRLLEQAHRPCKSPCLPY